MKDLRDFFRAHHEARGDGELEDETPAPSPNGAELVCAFLAILWILTLLLLAA